MNTKNRKGTVQIGLSDREVRNELYSMGLGHFWEQQEVCDVEHFSFLVEQRLTDAFIQVALVSLKNLPNV